MLLYVEWRYRRSDECEAQPRWLFKSISWNSSSFCLVFHVLTVGCVPVSDISLALKLPHHRPPPSYQRPTARCIHEKIIIFYIFVVIVGGGTTMKLVFNWTERESSRSTFNNAPTMLSYQFAMMPWFFIFNNGRMIVIGILSFEYHFHFCSIGESGVPDACFYWNRTRHPLQFARLIRSAHFSVV